MRTNKGNSKSSRPLRVPRGRRDDRRHTPKVNRTGLYQRAIQQSFLKLDPRIAVRNPVLFVVWLGTIVTALVTIDPHLFGTIAGDRGQQRLLNGIITLILFFTVLFANFAEAIAEGRGKARPMPCAPPAATRWPGKSLPTARSSRSVPRPWVGAIG